jgi:hypothetical protein
MESCPENLTKTFTLPSELDGSYGYQFIAIQACENGLLIECDELPKPVLTEEVFRNEIVDFGPGVKFHL